MNPFEEFCGGSVVMVKGDGGSTSIWIISNSEKCMLCIATDAMAFLVGDTTTTDNWHPSWKFTLLSNIKDWDFTSVWEALNETK